MPLRLMKMSFTVVIGDDFKREHSGGTLYA